MCANKGDVVRGDWFAVDAGVPTSPTRGWWYGVRVTLPSRFAHRSPDEYTSDHDHPLEAVNHHDTSRRSRANGRVAVARCRTSRGRSEGSARLGREWQGVRRGRWKQGRCSSASHPLLFPAGGIHHGQTSSSYATTNREKSRSSTTPSLLKSAGHSTGIAASPQSSRSYASANT